MNSRRKSAFETKTCQGRASTESAPNAPTPPTDSGQGQATSRLQPVDATERPEWQRYVRAAAQLRRLWKQESRKVFLPAFNQARVAERALAMVEGVLFSTGSGTLADAIRAQGRDQVDGSADMKSLSRMSSPNILFRAVFERTLPFLPKEGPIFLALDDTVLPKRGKKTAFTRWCHNPLVPPWQTDALMMGHPVFHAAVILMDQVTMKPLAITVAFEPVEPVPKELRKKKHPTKKGKKGKKKAAKSSQRKAGRPGRRPKRKPAAKVVRPRPRKKGRPTKEESERRKEEARILRERYPAAPDVAVAAIKRFRLWMDEFGMAERDLIVVGDGSYTNATVFFNLPDRCSYVGRVRPDATLEWIGAPRPGGGFEYGPKAPMPKSLGTNGTIPKTEGFFIYGGARRVLKFKEVGPVTRSLSTQKLQYRLLLLRPSQYKQDGRKLYTHEAYLLTSDHKHSSEVLISGYLHRWSIEVNHRNSKTDARIGKAHCRSARAVTRVHPGVAAGFALLWLCVLTMNGGTARTEIFLPIAHWQKANLASRNKKRKAARKRLFVPRASAVDVLYLFRQALHGRWERGLARIA